MRKIQRSAGVSNPRNVILVDDRPENVEEVRAAGFSAIEVEAAHGIRADTVDDALGMMRRAGRKACTRWVVVAALVVLVVCLSCTCFKRRTSGSSS